MTKVLNVTVPNDVFAEVEQLRLNSIKLGNKVTRSEVVQALIRKGLKEEKTNGSTTEG